jgi:hypothetical protein
MTRSFAVAIVLAYLTSCAWAQTSPARGTASSQTAMPASKPAAKKATPKAKAAAQPPGPTDKGPCQVGVIPAFGEMFAVQKVGFTVFGNDLKEVPIAAWGLDDLAVARVRAAAPGAVVRRITYPRSAFEPYSDPAPKLFRDPKADLTTIVRQIAANAGCRRYVVITRFFRQLAGTNQTMHGIGVVSTALNPKSGVIADVTVTIYDGQTFTVEEKPTDSFGARLTALTEAQGTTVDFPIPEAPAEVANNLELRDATRTLLASKLDKVLKPFFNQ